MRQFHNILKGSVSLFENAEHFYPFIIQQNINIDESQALTLHTYQQEPIIRTAGYSYANI